MMRSLWSAATGMVAQQINVDIISNNLANVNTAGFKKSRAGFQDLLYETLRPAASSGQGQGQGTPASLSVGHGVRLASTQRLFSVGNFQATQNLLDVAIEGDGFFQVKLADGQTAYTRDGSFQLDASGRLVTADGYQVQATGGGITVPKEAVEVTIAADGTVSVTIPGESQPRVLGQIALARFANPAGLKPIGHNLYLSTPASGTATTGKPGSGGAGTMIQGYLEMSNVQVVEEMVALIVAQRAYEMNAKAVQSSDDMLSMANNLRR